MKATISPRRMFGSGPLILVLAGILGTAMWIWQDLRFELRNRGEPGLEALQVFGTPPDFSFDGAERTEGQPGGFPGKGLDRQARIRGYYRSDDEDALRRLQRDASTLLKEDRS
jgi:hypothetical protein